MMLTDPDYPAVLDAAVADKPIDNSEAVRARSTRTSPRCEKSADSP